MLPGNAEVDLGHLDAGIERLEQAHRLLSVLSVSDEVRGQVSASLGNAYLRLAETENCCARHSPESCIVPLRGGAIHTVRRGSEQAIRFFDELLELPGADRGLRLKCLGLTNLAYMTLGGYPDGVPEAIRIPPSVFESRVSFPRYSNVAGDLGIDRFNLAGRAVVDDFDNDGDLDLYVGNESTPELEAPCQLFRNRGDGTLEHAVKEKNLYPYVIEDAGNWTERKDVRNVRVMGSGSST